MGDLGVYSQRTRLCCVYGDFHLRDAQLIAQDEKCQKTARLQERFFAVALAGYRCYFSDGFFL